MTNDKILNIAIKAARKAGEIILHSKAQNIEEKSQADYVTEVDIECQNVIKSLISAEFPDHNFLAEEDGGIFTPQNKLWIIDPLDGTTNFIHDLKHSAVSIAFYNENEVKVGVIYQPYRDELFYAIKGGGAFLNNVPILVSKEKFFSKSIIATGMPFRKPEKRESYFNCLSEVLSKCSGIRRMGSAAIDLAYISCGRFDGFFEGWLSPWDIAAGILLIKEAGGIVTDFKGDKEYFYNGCIVAGNEIIHKELLKIIKIKLGEKQ